MMDSAGGDDDIEGPLQVIRELAVREVTDVVAEAWSEPRHAFSPRCHHRLRDIQPDRLGVGKGIQHARRDAPLSSPNVQDTQPGADIERDQRHHETEPIRTVRVLAVEPGDVFLDALHLLPVVAKPLFEERLGRPVRIPCHRVGILPLVPAQRCDRRGCASPALSLADHTPNRRAGQFQAACAAR